MHELSTNKTEKVVILLQTFAMLFFLHALSTYTLGLAPSLSLTHWGHSRYLFSRSANAIRANEYDRL